MHNCRTSYVYRNAIEWHIEIMHKFTQTGSWMGKCWKIGIKKTKEKKQRLHHILYWNVYQREIKFKAAGHKILFSFLCLWTEHSWIWLTLLGAREIIQLILFCFQVKANQRQNKNLGPKQNIFLIYYSLVQGRTDAGAVTCAHNELKIKMINLRISYN